MRYMRIATGDHASGGVSRFVSRFLLINDQHPEAVGVETPRKRQPNDASAYDNRIPSLHLAIVEQRRWRRGSKRRSLRNLGHHFGFVTVIIVIEVSPRILRHSYQMKRHTAGNSVGA